MTKLQRIRLDQELKLQGNTSSSVVNNNLKKYKEQEEKYNNLMTNNRLEEISKSTYSNHYVYKLTHKTTKETYIGVRSCEGNIYKDDYYGSMTTWDVTKKDLTKYIIKSFNTREDAERYEAYVIYKNLDDPKNMNYAVNVKLLSREYQSSAKHQIKKKLNKYK